jgi:hypothetical protein
MPSRKSDESKMRKPAPLIKRLSNQMDGEPSARTEIFSNKNSNFLAGKLLEYSNDMQTQP